MTLSFDTKSMLSSRAVWGGIIAVLAGIANIFGYALAPADQAVLVDTVTGVVGSVGGLIAVYGRVTATRQIR